MAFGLFGDSYIKWLHKFSQGNLHVPGSSTFVYQGGLKFSRIDAVDTLKKRMKAARPRIVFLSIGGNDISPISDPDIIYENICSLVKEFEDVGVRRVHISEILPRADFSKSDPLGLTKAKFDRQEKNQQDALPDLRWKCHKISWH